MHSLKSRNAELNSYINNFLDIHYQPQKMLWWRVLLLSLVGLILFIKDYQTYDFRFEQWFAWTPLFILFAGFLTLNFQSLWLGSISFQYRHHDTAFVIARKFSAFNYSALINGLESKLENRKRACNRVQLMLFLLLIGVLGIINARAILWQLIFNEQIQIIAFSVYIAAIMGIILAAAIASMFILTYKRQLELLELSLFWIKLASTIKYMG